MEAVTRLTAEEERRLKLLEYLAAKGKLKPKDSCKPYLKDSTNLQHKRPQEAPKQICKTRENASNKGSHFAFESSKNKTSIAGSLPHKPSSGRIPTQKAKPLTRNLPPAKCSLPRARPDQRGPAARILQPCSVPKSRVQEGSEEAKVKLTVILTKTPGEKPEICVMDKTSATAGGQHAPELCTSTEESLSPTQPMPVPKSVTKTKSLHSDYKTRPSAGKPVTVAGSGHIRIVSRVSLPGTKSESANERSFLIKSSRNDGHKQPLHGHKEQVGGNAPKMTCTSKHTSAIPVSSSTSLAHKKTSVGPVSAPKRRQNAMDFSSNRTSYSQNLQNKLIAPRKSTVPAGCSKIVNGSKEKHSEQKKENKKQGVTAPTGKGTAKPSNMVVSDPTMRPQTPRMTAEDRKKKLQEWLNSKGKTYKRPPMTLPPKRPPTAKKPNPCNRSLWEGIEEEEELLSLSKKIGQTLSDCLELIEKGISADDIHAALDNVPEAKKFAKYWVCKARLLEREGVYDVIDVYKQGVQFGAMPIDELRDVVFDIMKNTNRKTKVVTFGPLPVEDVMEDENNEDIQLTPFTVRTEESKTPCTVTSMCDQGSAVKLQISSLSNKKKVPCSGQEWKRLTPVRRSVRISYSASLYPEVVQEHDTVVSSLEELLDKADTDAYLYVRNEALPEEAEHSIISLTKKDPTEGQHEGPV